MVRLDIAGPGCPESKWLNRTEPLVVEHDEGQTCALHWS
jgi:hypothetical protein